MSHKETDTYFWYKKGVECRGYIRYTWSAFSEQILILWLILDKLFGIFCVRALAFTKKLDINHGARKMFIQN